LQSAFPMMARQKIVYTVESQAALETRLVWMLHTSPVRFSATRDLFRKRWQSRVIATQLVPMPTTRHAQRKQETLLLRDETKPLLQRVWESRSTIWATQRTKYKMWFAVPVCASMLMHLLCTKKYGTHHFRTY
jgi:hypothetical protein